MGVCSLLEKMKSLSNSKNNGNLGWLGKYVVGNEFKQELFAEDLQKTCDDVRGNKNFAVQDIKKNSGVIAEFIGPVVCAFSKYYSDQENLKVQSETIDSEYQLNK